MSKEAKPPQPLNKDTLKLRSSNSSGESLDFRFYDVRPRGIVDASTYTVPKFNGYSAQDLLVKGADFESPRLDMAAQREKLLLWYDRYMSKPPFQFNENRTMKNVRTIFALENGNILDSFDDSATDAVINQRASELAGRTNESVIIFKAVTKVSPKYEVTVESL